jgi:hypothetical protein
MASGCGGTLAIFISQRLCAAFISFFTINAQGRFNTEKEVQSITDSRFTAYVLIKWLPEDADVIEMKSRFIFL